MYEIIIAGFGGQGVLTAGVILANAALKKDYNCTWLPSYGGEMRGGTANCSLKISKTGIGSPYIYKPDILVALNEPSLTKFENTVKPGGYIFINSSLVSKDEDRCDLTLVKAPITELATELGNARTTNILMLGILLAKIPIVSEVYAIEAISEFFKDKSESLIRLNHEAFKKGIEHIQTEGTL